MTNPKEEAMTPERSVEEIANGILPESAISVAGTEDADLERALAHIKIAFTEALTTERQARVEAEKKAKKLLEAEHQLSDAYLRIRKLLNAYDTPHAPTAEQVWAHTEAKLSKAMLVVEAARSVVNVTKNKMFFEGLPLGQREYLDKLENALHSFDEVGK